MLYRFIGNEAEISGHPALTTFGQSIYLEPEFVATIPKVPLLEGSVFDQIGFTSAELWDYSDHYSHADPPEEFAKKKRRAVIAWQTGQLPEE